MKTGWIRWKSDGIRGSDGKVYAAAEYWPNEERRWNRTEKCYIQKMNKILKGEGAVKEYNRKYDTDRKGDTSEL